MFTDLTGILIPKEIREGGGFYDISEKLSKDNDSIISITIVPNKNSNLYILKVTKENKDASKDVTSLNILKNFEVDKISRTEYFENRNVPLNSVIHLIVIPEEK